MYLISTPRVPMTKGKFAAQAGHATMLGMELSPENWLSHCWRWRGGQYAKVVLMADDLDLAAEYIRDRGILVGKVIDEGRTEFGADLTTTFLGSQIVDKDDANVKATFGAFKLYREPVVVLEDPVKRPFKHWIKERFGYGNTSQRGS